MVYEWVIYMLIDNSKICEGVIILKVGWFEWCMLIYKNNIIKI